jgi:hypothetical protein
MPGQVMQSRITELSQMLQEERRERRVFQEETVSALQWYQGKAGDNSMQFSQFSPVSEGPADSSWHSDANVSRGPADAKGPAPLPGRHPSPLEFHVGPEFESIDMNGDGVLDREEFERLNRVFKKDFEGTVPKGA